MWQQYSHISFTSWSSTLGSSSRPRRGGGDLQDSSRSSSCSKIKMQFCGENTNAKICWKIYLVKVYPEDHPGKVIQTYAVLDNQSNCSLAYPEFFNHFCLYEKVSPYTSYICSGVMETSGGRAANFVVESFDRKIKLPTLIECEMIPDDWAEIPTPEIVHYFPHLRPVADKIPPLSENAQIPILQRRDILRAIKWGNNTMEMMTTPMPNILISGGLLQETFVWTDLTNHPVSKWIRQTHCLMDGHPCWGPVLTKFKLKRHLRQKTLTNQVLWTAHSKAKRQKNLEPQSLTATLMMKK